MNRAERRKQRAMARQIAKKAPDNIEIFAALSVDAPDDETQPRISIKAYDGGELRLPKFPHPVVIDLGTAKFRSDRTVLLRDHDAKRPIGHAEEQTIHANHIEISGPLSVPGTDRDQVIAAAKSGFAWQASVGATGFRSELVPQGRRVQVNGRSFSGPIIIARHAQIFEVTVCPIGAARQTSVSIAASFEDGDEDMDFSQWASDQGFNIEEMSESQVSVIRAAFEAANDHGSATPNTNEGLSKDILAQFGKLSGELESLRTERERERAINRVINEHGVTSLEINGQSVILAEHAMEQGWSAERLENEILRANRPNPRMQRTTRESAAPAVIQAAFLASSCNFGEEKLSRFFDEQTIDKAMDRNVRNMSLHRLMDECIIAATGSPYYGDRKSNAFIEAAFEASNTLRASGTTTMSLPNIFEDVMNKVLLDQFRSVSNTWSMFCSTMSVNDFKAMNMYRLEASGGFRPVGKDGELKHMSLQDSKSTLTAETWGAIMTLTRKDLINDDMSALSQRVSLMGRTAAKKVEEEVYALLLANTGSFYHTNNNNIMTGANSALSYDALGTARQKFRDQTDANNQPILVNPRYLLVGTALESTANELMKSSTVQIGDTSGTGKSPILNEYMGLAEVIVSPYLNNSGIKKQDGSTISGQSATKWYLMSDPSDGLAPIRVGFLGGRQEPVIERAEMSFEKLGIQVRSYFDFGVAFSGDKQGSVYSAGA